MEKALNDYRLIKVGNPTCPACKTLSRMLKSDNIEYEDLNTDEMEMPEMDTLGLKSIPTLILMRGMTEVDRMVQIDYNKYKEIVGRLE